MKKITIADLKGDDIDVMALVENASEFSIEDSAKTLGEIADVCFELDTLREAIFFKQQKMLQSLNEEKEKVLDESCAKLQKAIEQVSSRNLPDTSEILNKRKMRSELEVISKVMTYNLNTGSSIEQMLSSMLNSDDEEDLQLLANIIQVHVNYSLENNDIYVVYSKKLELKVTAIFQKALKDGKESQQCKPYFEILKAIDKELVLVDIFLLSKSLLATNSNITAPAINEINVSQEVFKATELHSFINDITKTLEESYDFICKVFGLDDKYCEYIFTKISKTLIHMNLNHFLNVSNAAIFLLSLNTASSVLNSFSAFIKTLFPTVSCESRFSEVLGQFIYKAIVKEMHLFEEILEIFLTGAKSLNTYTLDGTKVAKTTNYRRIYENMFILITAFLVRREALYTEENEAEVLRFCAHKMCVLVDQIVAADGSPWETMYILFQLYLMNKRILGARVSLFTVLSDKLVTESRALFESAVELVKSALKGEILRAKFNNEDGHEGILKLLRDVYKKSTVLGESNRKLLFYKLVDAIYVFFIQRVEQNDLDSKGLENATGCIHEVSAYFTINVSPSLEAKFGRLIMIYDLMGADKKHFDKLAMKYRSALSEKEMREVTKHRESREAELKNKAGKGTASKNASSKP